MAIFNIPKINSLFEMPIYSYSRLNCYLQCPRKYRFAYIDRIKTEIKETIESFTGNIVHETLRKLYKDLMYEKMNTLEELLEYLRNQWRRKWNNGILITSEDYTPDNYLKMAERFVRDYYKRYYPFNQSRTIALEERIIVDLDGTGRYKILGYIDRLAYRDGGIYEIHDYKTNMTLPINKYIEQDIQLPIYAIGVKDRYPDARDIRLIWHFLAFDREIEIRKDEEEFEELRQYLISLIRRIEHADEFPAKPSVLCDWCEYKQICGEYKHRYKLETRTLDDYLSDKGVQLVDRYAELLEKREKLLEEIDREIEKTKKEIIDFAKREGLDTVYGTKAKAKVIVGKRRIFPSKGDGRREELKEVLKKHGIWEQVSDIDIYKLSRLIRDGALPIEVEMDIRKFQEEEKVERVYLNRLREDEKRFLNPEEE